MDDELKKISEKMKLYSIMEKLLETEIPMIIKSELEKNNVKQDLDMEISLKFNLGEWCQMWVMKDNLLTMLLFRQV